MDKQILKLVSMLHIGKMIDSILAKSITEGLSKDAMIEIVKNNVEIKEMIAFGFSIAVEAFKKKADEDGKLDWKDALASLLDMSDEMIAQVIGDYVEGLLNEKEEAAPAAE